MDLSEMRQEFTKGGLSREDLSFDPIHQFEKWFQEATTAKLIEPNAFVLSTVNQNGCPSSRTVLLKFFDEKGFVFYTNYKSQKAKEIHENHRVSVLFPWLDLQRQVKIQGTASKIPTRESLKYFLTRPRGSQIGAWASNQSSAINNRSLLIAKFEEMKRKFEGKEVPIPDFWGGYRIKPTKIEFWQGRPSRLHDRFEYELVNGIWKIKRLAP